MKQFKYEPGAVLTVLEPLPESADTPRHYLKVGSLVEVLAVHDDERDNRPSRVVYEVRGTPRYSSDTTIIQFIDERELKDETVST